MYKTAIAAAFCLASSAALAQADLLPDIIVDPQRLFDNEIVTNNGVKQLRLANGTANIGIGKFHIYGGPDNGDGTQQVFQRVFRDDGTFYDTLAGNFVFHPTHTHVHLDNWASYRLREVLPGDGVGPIIGEGTKTSFCILDLGVWDSSLPGFLPGGEYHSCGSSIQGLSVGWVDVYSKGLPGQSIDITGVPDGEYWLESVVDPAGSFIESDSTNNSARIKVTIGDGGALQPDAFEPDDSLAATASRPVGGVNSPNLGPAGPERTITGLSIDASNDDDYFRFYMPADGTAADFVRITFTHSLGDLDMKLYNEAGTELDESNSTSNIEEISLDGLGGGTYYTARVFGFSNATNPSYTLTVDPSANAAPTVAVINPPPGDTRRQHAFETYTVTWSANDPDADPTWVSVYVNHHQSFDGHETLLPSSLNTPGHMGAYVINSAEIEPETYWVYTEITDGGTVTGAWSDGTITFYDCPADLTNDGVVDSGDLALFIDLFLAGDHDADLTGDGVVDSGDLSLFISLFLAGC